MTRKDLGWFLLKIVLQFLLGKIAARLIFKIMLKSLHIRPGVDFINWFAPYHALRPTFEKLLTGTKDQGRLRRKTVYEIDPWGQFHKSWAHGIKS